ncbi:MAG: hypothetical protein A2987_05950 [Omnitrophica bacterium RIFCSPLOWO2_01_FULL_45_10]|nr:MAG: hypothetical protein A2987_05950 [Omnitrophica bacterium RIFCSPLOWO2_01_FULL_45_10]
MKRILGLSILIVLLTAGYWGYKIKSQVATNLTLNTKIAEITDKVEKVTKNAAEGLKDMKKNARLSIASVSELLQKQGGQEKQEEAVKIFLKHGGIIEGRLLNKTQDEYTVEWKGEKFVVDSKQIAHVEVITQKAAEWQYRNDVVVKRTNGIILDGEIVDVQNDGLTILFTEGGGEMELGVKNDDIETLLFAPVPNKESREIEERLRTQFPKMKFYKEGNFTIITDSHSTQVDSYKKSVRGVYTEIYLKFYKLFNDKKALNQNYVVIFDDFWDYAEYAITDGVPWWAAVGYFDPLDKTLYCFNAFGERMEKMVFDVIVGRTGRSIDEIVKIIKQRVDERYHIFVDAHVKELTDRFWNTYSLYKSELTELTHSTLRHEFTHEVFHNWGLQNIILSKPNIDKEKLVQKKKEFLETNDYKKKEELLKVLMELQREPLEELEMKSAHSWLNEGIATYCATEPIGGVDEHRLFSFQEMVRKGELNPIEFLMSFKMGSFPGLSSEAMRNAYAESWAFTTFLMSKYPGEFMDYQMKMAQIMPKKEKDELAGLLESLNKDLPAVEKEFREYMEAFDKADDPYVASYMRYYKVWEDLLQSNLSKG